MKLDEQMPRILLITAYASLTGTRRLPYDQYLALSQFGFKVDLFLKDEFEAPLNHLFLRSREEIIKENKSRRNKIKASLVNLKKRILKLCGIPEPLCYYFGYRDEDHPPYDINKIVEKIEPIYDWVIIQNWEGFIGAKTIEAIYDKLHKPIVLAQPDYCAITGGCHYFYDCDGYKSGCLNCPGAKGKDFPAYNAKERKRIWAKTRVFITGNDYTEKFIKNSYVYNGQPILKGEPIIDEELFCPQDKSCLRNKLHIDRKYKYILSFGAQSVSEPRKGMKYLLEALDNLNSMITDEMRQGILFLIAGKYENLRSFQIPFSYMALGYLDMNSLADMYAVSDVFLCPSIEDAGPMMINQSISCGTPVVAFEMGAALSVIKDKGTGYVAKLCDSKDYADGILAILNQDDKERLEMREKCRELAMEVTSFEACGRRTFANYNKYFKDFK